jgi:hypothetical protein
MQLKTCSSIASESESESECESEDGGAGAGSHESRQPATSACDSTSVLGRSVLCAHWVSVAHNWLRSGKLTSVETKRLKLLLQQVELEPEEEQEVEMPHLSAFASEYKLEEKTDGQVPETAVAELLQLAENLNVGREGVEKFRLWHNK